MAINYDDMQIVTYADRPAPRRLDRLQRDVERIKAQIAVIERFGEDDFEDETVLMFTRHNLAVRRDLTYVALKKGNKWWVSDGNNSPYTWDELVEMMADAETVWQATSWEPVV